MKRYMLFAGDDYYPAGGWDDFIGSFDSVEDAMASFPRDRYDWWHIVDATIGQEVSIDELMGS
jgi:hypothetical protein